jgi:hypothetical protein
MVIDISPSQYDSYISGWYNNNSSVGGMDVSSTTPYTNNEPVIETDLINIGTFLQPATMHNMEFKLDRAMSNTDSITVYARPDLATAYTLIGTTTTNVLSNVFPTPIQSNQWIQYMITMCGSTSSSSFVRIREIRIRQANG